MLLVEDERTLADIIADTLGEKEFDVTVAYDGIEGLCRFDEARPDVVVTDIMMPGMDGMTATAKLREQSNVPVVVDAGLGAPSHAAAAMELGADAVLVNTAIAVAGDPVRMAEAFARAVVAGREAFEAGLGAQARCAEASSPLTSFLD